MPCTHPLTAWQPATGGRVSFTKPHGKRLQLPCNNCINCRIDQTYEWATRVMHEAQMHELNSFVTLTYDDDHIPRFDALNHRDFQLLIKRLRAHLHYHHTQQIRYFMCGEYGPKLGRPHYHAALFGVYFHDQYPWRKHKGNQLYRSPTLEKLWGLGNVEIGALTNESAAYIAGYVMKKVTGDKAKTHYTRLLGDGTFVTIPPEYKQMSRRPGIGSTWYDNFKTDIYKDGLQGPEAYLNQHGRKLRPPRYYDKKLSVERPEFADALKAARQEFLKTPEAKKENTPNRRRQKELVATAKANLKTKTLD